MKYGIFTKPIYVKKLVNYLNQYTDIDYIIETKKEYIYTYDFDIGISYCFPYIIDVEYIEYLTPKNIKKVWYNYHPALLPKYKGLNCYSDAIRDKVKSFGVSVHRMTNDIDSGEIFKSLMFKLYDVPIDENELGNICHYYLFQLFKNTITKLK